MAELDALVGADVGGTHTDVVAVVGGRIERGKALTTYDDFSRGVLDAVGVAAEAHGLSTGQLLGRTRRFVNGTTVVTNALLNLTGARVGVLVTDGFRDTFRFAGGPRIAAFDDHLQVNAPDVVAREDILEIPERIDYAGTITRPLDTGAVADAVDRLVRESGVDAVAVCFISSFLNPEHELAARAVIAERHPGLFVTLSHEVSPVLGENRRWTTAVLNSFVRKAAGQYLASVDERLRGAGLRGNLAFFQGLGGVISRARAEEFPLALLGSGPAGGAIGAGAVAGRMAESKVLVGDMGGTSFEAGLLLDGRVRVTTNVQLGLLHTGANQVDLVSVGAGGGSLAWVSDRGVPQVGPRSAGSDPGPAAYDRGGTEPTVTDALVVMGLIDPAGYLGGKVPLRADLSAAALTSTLGDRFGWSCEESAAAVHDLVVVNMAAALREVSVAKGHDPRDFAFLAYGGTLPLFAVQIAERLGISRVVVPHHSSVFSALGLLHADSVARFDQTVNWNLGVIDEVKRVNAVADRLVEAATAAMTAEGFAPDGITVRHSGEFRFRGQAFQLPLELPGRPLTGDDAAVLAKKFFALYERTYGEGTAWRGVPEQMLNYTVTASGAQTRPELATEAADPRPPDEIRKATRRVYLPSLRDHREVPVYADEQFTAGSRVSGPAIIDLRDTTVYLPPGAHAERDRHRNYVLTREES